MDLIAEIVKKLGNYPDITPIYDRYSVTVEPLQKDGFNVSIIAEGSSTFIVAFEGWHEHFSDPSKAADCFSFGLLGKCRIKVTMRGKTAYKWSLQTQENGKWETDSTTGLLFIAFWRAKSIQYLSNAKT